MLTFLADEDFNGAILRELRRRIRSLDVERIQDVDRSGESDPDNLEYAGTTGRILLTHDKRLIPFVAERIDAEKPMPGVFVIHQTAPIGHVLADLEMLIVYSLDEEWANRIVFVPLAE